MTTTGFWGGFFQMPYDILYAFQHTDTNEVLWFAGAITFAVVFAFLVALGIILLLIVLFKLIGVDDA